jgi:CheY-like chemotaxis protein
MNASHSLHAVIIEDDHMSVDVLTALLSQSGIDYSTYHDPQDALDSLHQVCHADIIFVDLDMPHLNGYQVLETLQNIPETQNLPIVAYTSHTSEMTNARNAGFHSFLGKPLVASRFPEHLSAILNNQSVWDIR